MSLVNGARIKDARKKAGLTLDEVAKQLGISKRTVINYESNKQEPSISILMQMAKIYSVNFLSLLLNQDVTDDFVVRDVLTDPKVEYKPKFENKDLIKKLLETDKGREFFISFLYGKYQFEQLANEALKLFIEKQTREDNHE